MRTAIGSARETALAALVGLVAAVLIAVLFPSLYWTLPDHWETSRGEARDTALEALRQLAPLPEDALVDIGLNTSAEIQGLLRDRVAAGLDPAAARVSRLALRQALWRVKVYPPGAGTNDWTHQALVSPQGALIGFTYQPPERRTTGLDEAAASAAAEKFLRDLGIALELYESGEVRVRGGNEDRRVSVRYRDREALLGEDHPYGLVVTFAGDEVSGYLPFRENPDSEAATRRQRSFLIAGTTSLVLIFPLLLVVAVPFLKLYHDGQLGVGRGFRLLLLVLAAGLVISTATSLPESDGWTVGPLTRLQNAFLLAGLSYATAFMPMAVLSFMAWSAGEYYCRKRGWGHKLAAFDGFAQGRWANATVARSVLYGTSGGLVMTFLFFALARLPDRLGFWAKVGDFLEGPAWPVSPLVLFSAAHVEMVPVILTGVLLVTCLPRSAVLGAFCGWLTLVAMSPQLYGQSALSGYAMWAIVALVPLGLFLRYDLLSAFIAGGVSYLVTESVGMVFLQDQATQWNGYMILLLAALPLILTLRHLQGGEELSYTWDDVPAHVRRISERERQRVELETASEIQSSILPDLPPSLNGVEIAASYLPATEVGGDFYDVLALDDGRLAVAVGDVAGHGVSSGLVMSMAKSALSVQVTFNPEVDAVFKTLNRMVYQGARRRMLTTLCYSLIDPKRHELTFASAGHIYPYRVSAKGDVEGLTTSSYPLGVRQEISVDVRVASLEPGDTVFLLSDGLVEAHPEGSEEAFGFERLEKSLQENAGKPPAALRDGVLVDVENFVGRSPWEDDLTVVALRLPAAP